MQLPWLRCGVLPRLVLFVLVLALSLPSRAHADERVRLFAELDPLTFANAGYGSQLGIRHPALRGVRIAVASFSLHVPDVVSQLGGNDGFDLRVRPSAALYVLYYFSPPGRGGFAVGGSLRYLRLRYRHDDVAGEEANVGELSPEAILAYQWHPFKNGFYVQPWVALGVALSHDGKAVVGPHTYNELPVIPFFTVNVGWELAL